MYYTLLITIIKLFIIIIYFYLVQLVLVSSVYLVFISMKYTLFKINYIYIYYYNTDLNVVHIRKTLGLCPPRCFYVAENSRNLVKTLSYCKRYAPNWAFFNPVERRQCANKMTAAHSFKKRGASVENNWKKTQHTAAETLMLITGVCAVWEP